MRPAPYLLLSLLVVAIPSVPVLGERAASAATTEGPVAAHPTSEAAGLSLAQAVERAQRQFDARVVRAEETREGDDVIYRIRLLAADGRVFTVRVNARTGRAD